MASGQKLTDYERKRLENIRRNQELIASLKIRSAVSELSSASKRARTGNSDKSYKSRQEKRPSSPPVVRRSLRARGMPPDFSSLPDDGFTSGNAVEKKQNTQCLGPYSMKDAYEGPSGSDRSLFSCLQSTSTVDNGSSLVGNLDLNAMCLKPENVARILPGRITSVKFFLRTDIRMIVAGNRFGNVAFWNVDHKEDESKGEESDGIYLYRPHSAPVSSVVFQQSFPSKIITSSYDGFVRCLDAEKEIFDLVHVSDHAVYSMSQNPSFAHNLYLGDGGGDLVVYDQREKKALSRWMLHEKRINSIDFNSQNSNILLTCSSDRTACVWDIRKVKADKPDSFATVSHGGSINSSFFSPSGKMFATTSLDDTIGIASGVNFEEFTKVYHFNQTGRWVTTFKAIWGWDDSYIFVGNMKRKIDVICSDTKIIKSLESENMSAIPCRYDKHPSIFGTLAGATSGGQVYIWTCEQAL